MAGHEVGVAARRRLEAGTLERSLAAVLVAAGAASVIGGAATF